MRSSLKMENNENHHHCLVKFQLIGNSKENYADKCFLIYDVKFIFITKKIKFIVCNKKKQVFI